MNGAFDTLSELDAKNASVNLGVCEGRCEGCSCRSVIRTVCQSRGLTLALIRGLKPEEKFELANHIRELRSIVGERVEEGVGGCDHTDLHRFRPLPPYFLDVPDDEL